MLTTTVVLHLHITPVVVHHRPGLVRTWEEKMVPHAVAVSMTGVPSTHPLIQYHAILLGTVAKMIMTNQDGVTKSRGASLIERMLITVAPVSESGRLAIRATQACLIRTLSRGLLRIGIINPSFNWPQTNEQ